MIHEPKHGEEHQQKIKVNNGNTQYFKRKKFCIRHGWIDLFLIGGELAWHRQHSDCDKQQTAGAYVETMQVKVMKAAA